MTRPVVISIQHGHSEAIVPAEWAEGARFAWLRRSSQARRTALVDCRPGGGPIIEMGVEYDGPSFHGWAARLTNEPDVDWEASNRFIRVSRFNPSGTYSDRCCTWFCTYND